MLYIADFGSGKAGLTTVGYTLYNTDDSTEQARTTSGVFEVGTNTGVYACDIAFSSGWEGVVLFDTGEASARYVAIDYTYQKYLDQNLSDLPNDTADAVWDELLVDHNTVNTFGRRINTWPLAPIRDSILEIVRLMKDLDDKIGKKFKTFSKFLKEKLDGDLKEEIDKIEKNNIINMDNLDSSFNKQIDILKGDFNVLTESISNFSEKLKLVIVLDKSLKESQEKVLKITKYLSGGTDEIKNQLKNILKNENLLLNCSRGMENIFNHKAEQKDVLDIKNSLIKLFTDVFPLIKTGIIELEKNLQLVAKMSSRNLSTNDLEEILKEEEILKDDSCRTS